MCAQYRHSMARRLRPRTGHSIRASDCAVKRPSCVSERRNRAVAARPIAGMVIPANGFRVSLTHRRRRLRGLVRALGAVGVGEAVVKFILLREVQPKDSIEPVEHAPEIVRLGLAWPFVG